jgi:predicted lactoylglutathione lyase
VSVPARVSFVTLAVRDLPRMWEFFRQFGWPEPDGNDEHHVVFQCGGAVLALYAAKQYEPQFGPAPPPGAFKGFTLCINLESPERVDEVFAAVRQAEGVRDLDDEPQDASWGRGFSFRDPEDNVWDVAWADGTSFDTRGGLIWS